MKHFFHFACLFIALFGSQAFAAKPQAILGPGTGLANFRVPYHQTSNVTLSADTTYILTGWYFVDSTYSLTVPAGTLVRGDSASGGTLIVRRGAQIFAAGTATKPIIFTSNKPAGERLPGDWGGVIILGAAPTNQPTTQQIEGGFNTIAGAAAQYGGNNPDDNSGILQYVRIEFAGIAFSQDNEINGLTFGGVGRGTTVDHIQVSFANDDDYEFFGGTVQAKYLIGWRSLDDCFDSDFGFAGKLQFCYDKRDPSIFDASASGSSNGFESDNEGTSPYASTPRTKAIYCNMTVVGPAKDSNVSINSKWDNTAMLRRATELSIFNSMLMGWKKGIVLRDTLTQRAAIDGRLQIRNTSLATPRTPISLSSSPNTGNIAGFDADAWFNTGTGNIGNFLRQASDLGYTAELWNLDATNNPVPPPATEAATGGTSYQGRLSGDTWFDSVSYRGAFDPSKPRYEQWDWGWANYDPNNYEPENGRASFSVNEDWNLVSVPLRNLSDSSKTALFPTATSAAYAYDNGYATSTNLRHGVGYWLQFGESQGITLNNGQYISQDTMYVVQKWNLIGAPTSPVSVGSIVEIPSSNVQGSYFGYDNGYNVATELEPGKAYWVKVANDGELITTTSFASLAKNHESTINEFEAYNSLQISNTQGAKQMLYFANENLSKVSANKYEMPPVPPAGIFDARFGSQRMLELYPETFDGSRSYPINISSKSYPVKIKISLKDQGNIKFTIDEISDGNIAASHTVKNNEVLTLNNPSINKIVLTATKETSVPVTYSLKPNYPNPFNPSTTLQFSLVNNGLVTLKVYNLLGQEIAELANLTEYTSGNHQLQFNAGNLSSGTYYYRITVQDAQTGIVTFRDQKTMLLVK